MAEFLFANNAQSALAGSISNSSTVLNLLPGGGAQFPSPGAGQQFELTIVDTATGLIREIVYCTSRTADTLTVVRAREGTTALSWAANSPVALLVTKGQMEAFLQESDAQYQTGNYGVDTGAVNAYVTMLTPAVTSAPPAGMPFRVRIKAGNTNTGASTLNAGWGNANIVRTDGSALIGLELVASQTYTFIWTASGSFQLQSPGPATSAAVTAGTDTRSFITPALLATALGTKILIPGQCYMYRTSATQIRLIPFNGQLVPVAGSMQAIGTGINAANTGITLNGVGGQNLSADAGYLVALNQSNQLEFWTLATGHSTSSTAGNIGTEIITGQNTKTLVGMVFTDASSEFVDTDGSLYVLSWFNRKLKTSRTTFTSGAKTYASNVVGEIDSSIVNNFLTWGSTNVEFDNTGSVEVLSSGMSAMTSIGFDGTTPEREAAVFTGMHTSTEGSSEIGMTNFSGVTAGLAEGQHSATLLGCVVNSAGASGTADWTGGTGVISAIQFPRNNLAISVQG
jgi:hypothetical protein